MSYSGKHARNFEEVRGQFIQKISWILISIPTFQNTTLQLPPPHCVPEGGVQRLQTHERYRNNNIQ